MGTTSQGQVDDLDELIAVDNAFAPRRVEIGERLFRDGLVRSLTLPCLSEKNFRHHALVFVL